MSIDAGSEDPRRNKVLAMVKEGMHVVDVGTVSFVLMADLNDADDVGAVARDDVGLIDLTADSDGDDDSVTERMERSGYVKIDASGIFTGDTYIAPYQIGSFGGDTLCLTLDKDAIEKPA